MADLLAYLGGTFDPIHYGHLKAAEALAKEARIEKITLLPNGVPPHRPQPIASAQARADMVRLAISEYLFFDIDTRELDHESASYTVETLEVLVREYGKDQPLGFILGQDALLNIDHWFRWRDLLQYCHLLICQRPGYPMQMPTAELQQWLDVHRTRNVQALTERASGLIWLCEIPVTTISSTEIRERCRQGQSCKGLLPSAVIDYIEQHEIYSA